MVRNAANPVMGSRPEICFDCNRFTVARRPASRTQHRSPAGMVPDEDDADVIERIIDERKSAEARAAAPKALTTHGGDRKSGNLIKLTLST